MNVFRAIFKKNIVLLLSSQLVSTMGSIMQTTALALFVLTLKGSTAVTFASVLAVSVVPRLFGPFTGVLTDRANRKHMLIVLDLLAGVIMIGFTVWYRLSGGVSLTFVYCLVLALSVVQTFYDPTVSAIIPEIVSRDALEETNSASSFVSNTAYIAAAALAGILYNRNGLYFVLLINAASFLLAAAAEAFIGYKAAPELHRSTQEPVFQSMKEGLLTVFKNKELTLIVVISVIANLAINPICTVGIPFVMKRVLYVTNEMFGLSQAMLFVGPVIGSVLAMLLLKRVDYKRMLTWILVFDSALVVVISALTMMGLVSPGSRALFLWINLAALLIVAAFVLGGIAISTAIQKLVPVQLLGRVSAVDNSYSLLAIPLGQLLFGVVVNVLSPQSTLLIFGGLTLVTGVTAFALYRPMLKNMKDAGLN